MIASAIMQLLGLSGTIQTVVNVISATKEAVETINATKELLSSDDGEKWKHKIIELMQGSSTDEDGKVTLDVAKPSTLVPKGKWVLAPWDPIEGYQYVWQEDAE